MKKFTLSFILALSFIGSLKASNFYWVGGSGNWSDYATHWATTSGGAVFHTTIPTINDNVFLDGNSFSSQGTVTLDSTFMYCNNFNCSGLTQAVQFTAPIFTSPVLNVYGDMQSSSNATWSIPINMEASVGTHAVASNGGSFYRLYFNGAGIFNLTDDISSDKVTMNNTSTLNTNNHNVNVSTLENTTNSVFNVGSSHIVCHDWSMDGPLTSNYPTLYFSGLVGCNYATQFDTVVCNGAGGGNMINGPLSCNYLEIQPVNTVFLNNTSGITPLIHKAVFAGGVDMGGDYEFDSLIFSGPGSIIDLFGDITINQGLVTNGTCDAYVAIDGGTIHKTSGAVTLDYINLQNNTATGGAIFTANNSVDLGGNTGWSINGTAPRNLYWVGGSGNWNDALHWSLTSGGAGGNCLPSPADNVFFDASSFTSGGTVTLTVPDQYCNNFNCSGLTQAVQFTAPIFTSPVLNVYGDMQSSSNATWSIPINMEASVGTHAVASNGGSFYRLYFNGAGIFNLTDDISSDKVTMNNTSTLNTNNHNVNVSTLENTTNSVFNVGSSHIVCHDWSMDGPLTSNYPTLYFSGLVGCNYATQFDTVVCNGAGGGNMINGPLSCNYLEIQPVNTVFLNNTSGITPLIHKAVFAGGVDMGGDYEFDSLIFSGPGSIIDLFGDITINQGLVTNGTCDAYVAIDGGTIHKTSGAVTLDYINLQNNTATGGAIFTANNSVDLGGNTGWSINGTAPRNLYWVGGSGNWNDALHWSLTSGGAGGNCLPSPADNVFFDASSFTSGGTVTLTVPDQYCNNFNCSGLTQAVQFTAPIFTSPVLNVYGDMQSSSNATWSIPINMEASVGTHAVASNGGSFYRLYFNGAGIFNLTDDISSDKVTMNNTSTLNTNNNDVNVSTLENNNNTVFNVGSSHIVCHDWSMDGPLTSNYPTLYFSGLVGCNYATQFDTVVCNGAGGGNMINGPLSCNYLEIQPVNTVFLNNTSGITPLIHKAVFAGGVDMGGDYEFDSLLITSPGQTIDLFGDILINQHLYIESYPGFPAMLSGGTITKTTGQVCLDYMLMDNTTATGGAQFFAGSNSVDLGGTSGWSYTNCAPYISNVWPGDANYDLTCDNLDLLNVGLAYGYTGIARTAPTITWVAQLGTDWLQQFINGANLKHADCDGDGTVAFADTLAISQNYGLTHPARVGNNSGTNSFGAQLYFDVPSGSLQPGSVVTVPIKFGTSTAAVSNLYGIAFTVDYDPSLIQANSVSINYTGSWLPTAGSYLHIERDFSATGKIDMALTRTDHLNVSNYGTIANLVFTVANNASGPLQLGFSKIRAVSANEFEIPVQANTVSVITSVNSLDPENTFTVFPNPFKNQVAIINSNYKTGEPIEVFNIYGTKIYSTTFTSEQVVLNTDAWKNGVYFIHTGGSVVKVNKSN